MKKPSKLTMIVVPLVVGYLGLHGYDYYKLRKEKHFWSQLLEDRVGRKPMKITEDLNYVKILLTKEGKDGFYDYAKDLLKYLDYEVKELPETPPGQAYTYLKEHLTDSDGLIVVGHQLFKELIEAYNHHDDLSASSSNPLLHTTDASQTSKSSRRWFSWPFFRRRSSNSPPKPSSVNDASPRLLPVVLGYLPLKKDIPNRPWYAGLLDHFFEFHEARRLSYAAWVIADGFTEVIGEHCQVSTPLLPSPFITFKEHLVHSSPHHDNLKPMKVFSSDPSFSPIDTAHLNL